MLRFWLEGEVGCCWDGRPQRTDAAAVRGRSHPPSLPSSSQLHSSGREGEAIDRAGCTGGASSEYAGLSRCTFDMTFKHVNPPPPHPPPTQFHSSDPAIEKTAGAF